MNKDTLKGQWKQVKGTIQKQWGKLTNDDMDQINGSYDELVGKVQQRYGENKETTKKKVDEFLNSRP